jgi:hypothetical protein
LVGGVLIACLGGATQTTKFRLLGDEPAKPKRTAVGKNVFFEVDGTKRRVIVNATVCLRRGQLEGLLCTRNTKEHEYILSADVDARQIHAALIAAGAKPGAPVQFLADKYVPARGPTIKVWLRYEKGGKTVTVAAQEWIHDGKAKKPLAQDWVFGGSRFLPNEDKTKPPIYLANYGDVICVCNMDTAMLDLPVRSPKRLDDRIFDANTDAIPPVGTKVEVLLEPVPEKKKEK